MSRALLEWLWLAVGVALLGLGCWIGIQAAPAPAEIMGVMEQTLDSVVRRAEQGPYVIESRGVRVRIELIEESTGG